ncbi:MAG: hypothetical protein CMH83_21260 [Nocardioides sp.]|nr:hypothetical protein [Nocardioides sp.]
MRVHGRYCVSSGLFDLLVVGAGRSVVLPVPGQESGRPSGAAGSRLVGLVRGGPQDELVLPTEDGPRFLPRDHVVSEAVSGLDPLLGLTLVRSDYDPVVGTATTATGDVLGYAARLLADELVGVAEGALALALEHVRERHQFGVPIGSFQAVRHRLVDAYVDAEGARSLLAAIGPDAAPDVQALVLKASAGAAALRCVAAAQQVCGGMGFTAEFDLHRYVRRALALDALLSGSEAAEEHLGALALRGRVLPDRQVVLT